MRRVEPHFAFFACIGAKGDDVAAALAPVFIVAERQRLSWCLSDDALPLVPLRLWQALEVVELAQHEELVGPAWITQIGPRTKP